jgi:hypothetical protein
VHRVFVSDFLITAGYDFLDDFFFGALAPFFRAFESPIAIACFLLVTFLPDFPLFKVPFFRSRIAFLAGLFAVPSNRYSFPNQNMISHSHKRK